MRFFETCSILLLQFFASVNSQFSDFVFPSYNVPATRPQVYNNPGNSRPQVYNNPGNSRPQVYNNPGNSRPQVYNNPGNSRPQVYNNPGSSRPQATQNGRISERKCKEYSEISKKAVNVGALSFFSPVHGIQTHKCDATQGLVVGGENALAGEFPHMAAIYYKNALDEITFGCGGSLISERFVLTSAHCKSMPGAKASFVRLGTLDISGNDARQDVPIEQFISHEQYNKLTRKNDIGLAKLNRAVTLGILIRPACISSINTANKRLIVTGWGRLGDDKNHANILQKAQLDITDFNQCNYQYYDNELDNTQMCAGAAGKDSCRGDSGGPLQLRSTENSCVYHIIGVTTYGQQHCGYTPGVYTRVAPYLDWIERKVWQ